MTKEELLKQHADYRRFSPEWLFFVRSYFGGKRYAQGRYLLQHPFESDDTYTRRLATAYFYNYCAPVVDIFVSLLFKKEPSRNFGSLTNDPLFNDFLSDADFTGNTYPQFIREAQRYASIYGRVSVLVDKPSIEVDTKARAQELGVRPYLNLITPENITDWQHVKLANGRVVLDRVKVVEEWAQERGATGDLIKTEP